MGCRGMAWAFRGMPMYRPCIWLSILHGMIAAVHVADASVSGPQRLFIAPGVVVRLTRNLDKERGFVNGATGTIDVVLENKSTFTVTLTGTKHRILVHRITDG
eukprot:1954140-Pyramimonas_sp.AAC.1